MDIEANNSHIIDLERTDPRDMRIYLAVLQALASAGPKGLIHREAKAIAPHVAFGEIKEMLVVAWEFVRIEEGRSPRDRRYFITPKGQAKVEKMQKDSKINGNGTPIAKPEVFTPKELEQNTREWQRANQSAIRDVLESKKMGREVKSMLRGQMEEVLPSVQKEWAPSDSDGVILRVRMMTILQKHFGKEEKAENRKPQVGRPRRARGTAEQEELSMERLMEGIDDAN